MPNLETAMSPRKVAPHRHRSGYARRGARQSHDPAGRREQSPSGAAAYRRSSRIRKIHRRAALLGGARHRPAPLRHLSCQPSSGRGKGDGHDRGLRHLAPTAEKLRRLMHYGQMLQSHALHFFHLASPDILLGFDSDLTRRNILGVLRISPRSPSRASSCASSGRRSSTRPRASASMDGAIPGGMNKSLS